jgi:hypothetical protein
MDDVLLNAATNVNNRLRNNLTNFAELSPVVVRPSTRQIRDATQLIRFETIVEPPNATCPISLERFNPTDLVTRIVFCGHIFSSESIQIWFENNVRCPLCRFDIREHGNRMSAENRNLSPVNEETSSSSEQNSPLRQSNTYVSRAGNVNTISQEARNAIMELYDTDSDDDDNYEEISTPSDNDEDNELYDEMIQENIENLLSDTNDDVNPRPAPPPPPERYSSRSTLFENRNNYDVSNSLHLLHSAITENLLQDISQNGYDARITFINSYIQSSDASFNFLQPFNNSRF